VKAAGAMLDGIGIFADLGEEDREAVAALMEHRRCNRGELLFREGDPGDELFVVLSGLVSITVKSEDGGFLWRHVDHRGSAAKRHLPGGREL